MGALEDFAKERGVTRRKTLLKDVLLGTAVIDGEGQSLADEVVNGRKAGLPWGVIKGWLKTQGVETSTTQLRDTVGEIEAGT